MNIILVGCEYTGKTTLADGIVEWSKDVFGVYNHFHDHFTIPSTELTPDARDEYKNSSPQIKEMFQRFMIQYHLSDTFYSNPDHHLMGFHIEEAVYAPLYYGYGNETSGSPGRSSNGQRSEMAREIETQIIDKAPYTVLVLLHASTEMIQKRMTQTTKSSSSKKLDSQPFGIPTQGVVKYEDVSYVSERFHEEYQDSLIPNKFKIDTTNLQPSETLSEFTRNIESFLSSSDLDRIEANRSL